MKTRYYKDNVQDNKIYIFPKGRPGFSVFYFKDKQRGGKGQMVWYEKEMKDLGTKITREEMIQIKRKHIGPFVDSTKEQYWIKAQNPITRAHVIRVLLHKGYKLYKSNTISNYHTNFPANEYPYVVAYQNNIYISHYYHKYTNIVDADVNSIIDIKPNRIWFDIPNCILGKTPDIPKAAKYSLKYNKDGNIKNYIVSLPIEEDANNNTITVYCFGEGVRSFKRNKIVEFKQL